MPDLIVSLRQDCNQPPDLAMTQTFSSVQDYRVVDGMLELLGYNGSKKALFAQGTWILVREEGS